MTITPKSMSPINELILMLEQRKDQFQRVLPPDMKVDKWLRVAESFLQGRPELLNCDKGSLYAAIMRTAQEGLYLDGREASITSFRKNIGNKANPQYVQWAQFMSGYIGILKKVRKSGELHSINAYVVHAKDKFKRVITADGEQVTHEPSDDGDPGEFVKVWCVAKTKDGAAYVEVMSKAEVEKVRACSRNKDGDTWTTWFDEMAKKSVIRRISKRLPMGTDVESIFKAEEDFYTPTAEESVSEAQGAEPKKKSRLAKIVEEKTAEAPSADMDPPKPAEVADQDSPL